MPRTALCRRANLYLGNAVKAADVAVHRSEGVSGVDIHVGFGRSWATLLSYFCYPGRK